MGKYVSTVWFVRYDGRIHSYFTQCRTERNLESVMIGNILSWGCWSWIHLFICVAPVFIVFAVLSNVISTNNVGC